MSAPSDCPDAAALEDLLLGRADNDRAAVLEIHVGQCSACQRQIDELIAHLHWLNPLRGHASSMEGMIARLDDMAAQVSLLSETNSRSKDADQLQEERPLFDSPETTEEVGRLGSYRLLRLLGAGGMGLVYLAEDMVLRRLVALKLLRPYLARLPHARIGFLSEARAMAAVKHDNIVTVFQTGEAPTAGGETIPFLAMESLQGESLADWLRREGPLPAAWAARLGQQAAEGLAIAHAQGVVHRDIKPGNLWLEAPRGWKDLANDKKPPLAAVARLKILDFGLARSAEKIGQEGERVFAGTPAYMPPEQGRGEPMGFSAELFSLGVVLYQLTSGQLPFRHTRKAMDYRPPPPLRELVADIPAPFADLVHRLLALKPAERPAAAEEVAAELATLALPYPSLSSQAGEGKGEEERPRRFRRRAFLTASASTFLALLTVGTWFALRPSWTRKPSETLDALPGPPDEEWCRAVAALPPRQQPRIVVAKLRELNPGYDGVIGDVHYENEQVADFAISTDTVSDIRPVRAFPALRRLECCGTPPVKGKLKDLSPLRGMELTVLHIWSNGELSNLEPLRGMKLTSLQIGNTAVEDLSPLRGMPLTMLGITSCRRIKDVAVVSTLRRLRTLRCDGCPLTTLQPLAGTAIEYLIFDYRPQRGDAEALRKMPKLQHINSMMSPDQFLDLHNRSR